MEQRRQILSTYSTRVILSAPTVHNETAAPILTPYVHNETAAPVPDPSVHIKTDAPLPPPPVYNEGTVQSRSQPVSLQNEMLLSTQTDDAPKTIALTYCDDPLRPVQKCQSYYRMQFQRYK